MTSRIKLRGNPRIVSALVLPALMVVGGIVVLLLVNLLVGLLLLAVISLLGYRMVRYVLKQLASRVSVSEEGLQLNLYGEDLITHPWETVARAGVAVDMQGRRTLYAYREDTDKLIMIPDEFADFEDLVAAVASHTDLKKRSLRLGQTLNEALKEELEGDPGAAG